MLTFRLRDWLLFALTLPAALLILSACGGEPDSVPVESAQNAAICSATPQNAVSLLAQPIH
jgi:hypothetical protein